MIVYDVATKVLDTELFPQHTIADLHPGIIFIVLLSQEKPLHTHTHTHRHAQNSSLKQNTEGLFNVLANFFFATSETEIDYNQKKQYRQYEFLHEL